MATIKTPGLYDVADPDFDPYDGDQYDKQLFEEKQSFEYSVVVTSLQTDKGREKEFEGDSRHFKVASLSYTVKFGTA